MPNTAQPTTQAQVFAPTGLRLGFAWYDLVAERLWPRVELSVQALAGEDDMHYHARKASLACRRARHNKTTVVVYVNDIRRRG